MNKYNPAKIESKWQKAWQSKKVFVAKETSKKKKKYVLVEFPYPSGAGLHMGHLRPYVAGDVYSRYLRMQGHEVLYPIGWDAFGLPAENYAIKMGVHPSITTKKNVANAKKQMLSWGLSFDWSREINTTDPSYYKWTQWLFLQFYKKGLAYEATGMINWCPKDKTGLANEEVVDGKCERCGTEVVKKELRQWYLKITAYAEKLLEGLKNLPEWPEAIKRSQENWIGKSVGAEISFYLAQPGVKRYVLLHGKGSSPEKACLPWLKRSLETAGYEVQVPAMPGGDEPNDLEQAEFVKKNCTLDKQTVVLGHSFGGVVALRLLEQGIKVNKVILVATPFSGKFLDGKTRPTVLAAVKKGFDFEKIKKQAKSFVALYDTSDYVVPLEDGDNFAKKLNAALVKVKSGKPHFNHTEEPEVLSAALPSIKVFTTRPDTIFGATYMVVAPEHPLIQNNESRIMNYAEIKKYIESAKRKKEAERTAEGKEKTGVELKGIKAINPATKQAIPVWTADYVLWGYGTGAIMAVPAHDERDFEFAGRFGLEIKQVVAPYYVDETDPPKAGLEKIRRKAFHCIIRNPKTDEYLGLQWSVQYWRTFVTGGAEAGEELSAAAKREVLEETGYKNLKLVKIFNTEMHEEFYHIIKKLNRYGEFRCLVFDLLDEEKAAVAPEELQKHTPVWLKKNEVEKFLKGATPKHFWRLWLEGEKAYTEPGILINSGEFNGQNSFLAIPKMAEKFGRITVQYKLRDWVFSRQRYWGEPIPLVHCETCGTVPVPEKDLPVKLPQVAKYEPTGTGESPLAAIAKWVNVGCPKCKGRARRETNTMPQWAGSSWYWLRYADPKNKTKFADKRKLKYWQPVDVYFGGMEHTTLHLLYSRFWNLFFYDQGLVTEKEPYKKRHPHGIVLASDGEKMSKSRGNVVDPQIIVKKFGADTLRMYEMFLGPHELMVSWNDQGVVGVRRFLDRVWQWAHEVAVAKKVKNNSAKAEKYLHKLIKKLTEDIENFRFNTAISAFMEFHNQIRGEIVTPAFVRSFLKLLYPFASHIAEELNQTLGGKKTLQLEAWPKYDPAKITETEAEIVVQVNGKVRGKVVVAVEADEAEVKQKVLELQAVKQVVAESSIKRVIYVKGRLINLVV